jgi:hypothetical protein
MCSFSTHLQEVSPTETYSAQKKFSPCFAVPRPACLSPAPEPRVLPYPSTTRTGHPASAHTPAVSRHPKYCMALHVPWAPSSSRWADRPTAQQRLQPQHTYDEQQRCPRLLQLTCLWACACIINRCCKQTDHLLLDGPAAGCCPPPPASAPTAATRCTTRTLLCQTQARQLLRMGSAHTHPAAELQGVGCRQSLRLLLVHIGCTICWGGGHQRTHAPHTITHHP